MPRIAFRLGIFLAVVLVSAVAAVAGFWAPHVIPLQELAGVRQGMSADEVIAVLGPPMSSDPTPDGRDRLFYGRAFRYCSVDVFLDSSGHVSSVWHDH